MNRKVILYIAMSLDGYISKEKDNLSFLELVKKDGEDYGYSQFIKTIDTVILGRKTYDWVMKQVTIFPHADKETFVITRTQRPSIGNTQFYTGDLKELILSLKEKPGKNIFIDGGAEIVNELLKCSLIDEMTISIIPVLLGSGTQLFKENRLEQIWKLDSAKTFDTGLVQLHYKIE